MSQPSMPGFTAEVSLRPATGPFPAGHRPRRESPATFTPQLLVLNRRRNCDPNCVCVTGKGCPCCYSIPTAPTVRALRATQTARTVPAIRTMRARSGRRRRRR
jgi:hypothetical protein